MLRCSQGGTDYTNVINHEFGHIIDKNNRKLREKIINLLSIQAKNVNMSLEEYISLYISHYAAMRDELTDEMVELIAELEAMRNGTQNKFVEKLFSK